MHQKQKTKSAWFTPICLNLYYIISWFITNIHNNGATPQPTKRPAALRLQAIAWKQKNWPFFKSPNRSLLRSAQEVLAKTEKFFIQLLVHLDREAISSTLHNF